MTPEQLRWIDVLVAEHVMGARVTHEPDGLPLIQARPGEFGNPSDMARAVFAPPYTTSWDAAGRVVERMREQGWSFRIVDSFNGQTVVEFWRQGQPDYEALAAAFPLACSLAALRALKIEVPE